MAKYDERGLYLEVSPSGGNGRRLKYRFDDKEKRLPDVTSPLLKYFSLQMKIEESNSLEENYLMINKIFFLSLPFRVPGGE